jgi:hypothetical protein
MEHSPNSGNHHCRMSHGAKKEPDECLAEAIYVVEINTFLK